MLTAILTVALVLTQAHESSDANRCADGWYTSKFCLEEIDNCRDHRKWLVDQQRFHGYGSGQYQTWIDEMDFRIAYWTTLWTYRQGGDDQALMHLVGPQRHLDRWAPPLTPAWLHPPPPPPPPKVRAPEVNNEM